MDDFSLLTKVLRGLDQLGLDDALSAARGLRRRVHDLDQALTDHRAELDQAFDLAVAEVAEHGRLSEGTTDTYARAAALLTPAYGEHPINRSSLTPESS